MSVFMVLYFFSSTTTKNTTHKNFLESSSLSFTTTCGDQGLLKVKVLSNILLVKLDVRLEGELSGIPLTNFQGGEDKGKT